MKSKTTLTILQILEEQLGLDKTPLLTDKWEDLGADSLDAVEIAMAVEDELDIYEIDTEQKFDTVLDFVNYVKKQLKQSPVIMDSDPEPVVMKNKVPKAKKEKAVCDNNCGCSGAKNPPNHQKRWTDDDEKTMLQLYAAGSTINVIANVLGRTVISVLHRLSINHIVMFNKEHNAYFTVPTLVYQF